MKVLIGVLLSIFASAQAASLRGTSGSFLSNVDDNYGQCITGCNDLDTEERKICQDGCNDKYPHDAYGACNRRCARLRIAPGGYASGSGQEAPVGPSALLVHRCRCEV